MTKKFFFKFSKILQNAVFENLKNLHTQQKHQKPQIQDYIYSYPAHIEHIRNLKKPQIKTTSILYRTYI